MKKAITLTISLLFLSQIFPAVASPLKQAKSKSFAQWCQDRSALSEEAGKTVSILLMQVKTIDCKQANSRLKKMTSLDLSDKQIRDIQVLGSLSHLTSLNLTNNKISNLTPLTDLTKLKKLVLTKNKIEDVEPISALYELRELYLDDNEISNLKPLSTLRLKKLKVSKNNIDYEDCPIKGKSICIF
jgi:internalin A